ncbi:hypothetical protein RUM44_000355 [Polyplax serrata]|uniref:Protein farnesyltransferase subunit beta n=1 Tax=Polyplax serrata TaxID=468196 RepID=A0ABR1B575_POLSC
MNLRTRLLNEIKQEKFCDEGIASITSDEQMKVESSVHKLFEIFENIPPQLIRAKHSSFLKSSLSHLSCSYQCLDAGRPWLCYWILHSLDLLNNTLEQKEISKVADFLGRCQSPDGGFGGGPDQFPHLAPTYAAVNALCILGTEEAYKIIDREKLLKFLWKLKQPDGSFEMHEGGEIDMRGIYCAVSVAKLTNIYSDELFQNSAEWIASSQTYEGGFSGCPDMEAHGGYAFCGLAALVLLNKEYLLNIQSFLRWVVNRQMRFEGGFQGRTNKLVDGCYSFWQGGVFPIIHGILSKFDVTNVLDHDRWMFNQEALQEYILVCCQNSTGGLIDKPKKQRDFYHTCYVLSGLSVAQHSEDNRIIVGCKTNELSAIHPLYNIRLETVQAALQYFQNQFIPIVEKKI